MFCLLVVSLNQNPYQVRGRWAVFNQISSAGSCDVSHLILFKLSVISVDWKPPETESRINPIGITVG